MELATTKGIGDFPNKQKNAIFRVSGNLRFSHHGPF